MYCLIICRTLMAAAALVVAAPALCDDVLQLKEEAFIKGP